MASGGKVIIQAIFCALATQRAARGVRRHKKTINWYQQCMFEFRILGSSPVLALGPPLCQLRGLVTTRRYGALRVRRSCATSMLAMRSTRFRTTMLVFDDCCHGLALQHEDWHRPSHPRGTLHRRTALGGKAAAAEWGGSICSSRPACQKRYTLPLRAQADKIRRLYRTAMLLVRLYRTAMLLVRSICLLSSSPQFVS